MVEPISTAAILKGIAQATGIADRLGFIDLPGIGSLFGGGKSDRNLPFGASSFRDFGRVLTSITTPLIKKGSALIEQFKSFGFQDTDPEFLKSFVASQRMVATSPAHAVKLVNRASQAQTAAQAFIDQFKIENPDNPGVRRERKGPDIPRKVDKKQIGRVALRAARGFLRFPTQQPRPSGFVSKAGVGFRDISELEQDVDRIIPSGFISKQPTTQSRALALRRLS